MGRARMHQELNKARSAHPAIQSVAGAADAMNADPIATAARTKTSGTTLPARTSATATLTPWPPQSIAQLAPRTTRHQAPVMAMAPVNRPHLLKVLRRGKSAHGTAMAVIVRLVVSAQSKVIDRSSPCATVRLCQRIRRQNPASPTSQQALKRLQRLQHQLQSLHQ